MEIRKIINKQRLAFLSNLEKGIYQDNPRNRKLNRVGMPYGLDAKSTLDKINWDKEDDPVVKQSITINGQKYGRI